jgi:hypothetical protein
VQPLPYAKDQSSLFLLRSSNGAAGGKVMRHSFAPSAQRENRDTKTENKIILFLPFPILCSLLSVIFFIIFSLLFPCAARRRIGFHRDGKTTRAGFASAGAMLVRVIARTPKTNGGCDRGVRKSS